MLLQTRKLTLLFLIGLVVLIFASKPSAQSRPIAYVPTGTGFIRTVSGVETSTAQKVPLNDTAYVSGIVSVGNGGTGLSSPGDAGSVLVSNGSVWTAGAGPGAVIGTFASRPSTASIGTVFMPTDGGVQSVYDGTEWRNIINGALGYAPPLASNWTTYNPSGGSTITYSDQQGTLRGLWSYGVSEGTGIHFAAKSFSSLGATGIRVTIHLVPILQNGSGNGSSNWLGGVGWRQSSNGRINTYCWGIIPAQIGQVSQEKLYSIRYTANNTTTSPTFTFNNEGTPTGGDALAKGGMWMRIEYYVAGTLRYYVSPDSRTWRQINLFNDTTVFLIPDQIILPQWTISDGTVGDQGAIWDSYKEEAF